MPACVHGWSPLGACSICTPPSSRSSTPRFENPAEIAGKLEPGDYLIDARGALLRVLRLTNRPGLAGQYDLELFGTEVEYTTGYDDCVDVAWPLRRARVVVDE